MPRAAIIGNLVLDVVAGAPARPGGMVWYCARALSRVAPDEDVVLACRCAPAERDAIVPGLEQFGFPISWHEAETTTQFSFHYEGERRIMEIGAVADPWTPADVDGWLGEVVDGARWIVVGALMRTDFPVETLAALTARGHHLALDAQGLVRHGRVGPLVTDGDVDREVLRHVSLLKLNEGEAVRLCGGTDEASLRTLGVPEVVLTLGSEGALILSGESAYRVEAVPVEGEVDPTGAGDSFLVAYGYAREQGAGAQEAGELASRIVSEMIRR